MQHVYPCYSRCHNIMSMEQRQHIRFRAEALRELAARRNESLTDVAQAIETDKAHFSRLLAGKHEPSPAIRRRVLAHFAVDFDTLFAIVSAVDAATV